MTSTSAITSVTGTSANASADKTATSTQQLAGNFSEFLTLLTTQLQNQDPLNPMDSAQFTQQLVEYSQVEQQLNTNTKLDNLTTLSMNSSLSLALGYVGKDITYTSSEMNYDGASPVKISYNLTTASATQATANVLDESGNVVDTFNIDGTTGTHSITWDGMKTDGTAAAAGTYTIKLNALDSDGKAISTATAVTGLVRGIESQDGVPYLLVGDRSVGLGNIINTSLHADTSSTGTTA